MGSAVVKGMSPQGEAQPKYTVAEYNAFQAAAAEKNPQQKLKMLDAFVSQYPNSGLLTFVYNEYVETYTQLRQWPKLIEALDKLLAMPDVNNGARLQGLYRRAATFEFAYNAKAPNAAEQATKGRDQALAGLKVLADFKKPEQMTDEQWAAAKKQYASQFYNTAGISSLYLKDYKAAAENFSTSLKQDPQQAVTSYRLGLAALQQDPPQTMDGLWALARAIDLKVPDGEKIKKFLHDKIYAYQQPGCESSVDAQAAQLLALAANATERPADFTIPSAADLGKVREQANIQTVLADLKAGGNKSKLTWLAVCGGEFPEALAKATEVNATPEAITIKAIVGTTEEELGAATAPNADLKFSGQPEAARLEKDGVFRFKGKLTGYTPDPFYMTWENVNANPEDIPEEKKGGAKPPAKKAGKRPPAKQKP
jgi:hypothetical protein